MHRRSNMSFPRYPLNTTLFYDKDYNLHNENGPAVINPNGDCEWWLNGKKHRIDGPAISHDSDNYFEWWVDGKRHNENGPAICFANGNYSWFIDNINYSQSEFLAISRENKLKTILHESY